MAEKKIEDFGEKIGGARKDLYALNRELRYGDILDWNDMEKEKYITKKEAFPLPDYKKMLEEGKDREVIFFIKKVRDSLPTKPLAAIPYLASAEQRKDIIDTAQRDYLLTVNRFYEKAMSLTSLSECARFYDEIKSENLPDTNCFNRKLIKATDLGGRLGLYQFRRELENKQFLFSEDEKILSNFSFYRYDGQNVTKEEYREGKERLVIHESGPLDLYDLGDISQIGDVEFGGELHVRQLEIAVDTRQRAFLGALDGYRGGDDRLSLDIGHASVYGVPVGGGFRCWRGLFLGDGDALSVDGAGHLLSGEYLVEDLADGGVPGRNGDAFGEVHLVRTDDDGVIFRTVQRGYGLLNGYVLQFEVNPLRLRENRGRAE